MTGRILELKRWERVSYFPEGPDESEIRMELKRLKRVEAKSLRKVIIAAFAEVEKGGDASLTPAQKAAIMANVFEVVPEEQLQQLFADSVRNVDGLKIDDQAITRGSELLENADDGVLFFVLMNLQRLSTLSAPEAFRSGSRSTSPVETASLPASPASDAASTGNGDGLAPSTATATPAGPLSSSGSAGA